MRTRDPPGAAHAVALWPSRVWASAETEIASFTGHEAAVVLVGGWVTNVTTIDAIVGSGDLILGDTLNHNCLVAGQRISGATVMLFPHNNHQQADKILTQV